MSSSKLCANTSGYNLSEAAQSLAQPEDGSTNPARGFLQEGADAHPGDVRKRSNVDDAETSAKKKKLDGSVNRGKLFPGADDTGKSPFYGMESQKGILVLYSTINFNGLFCLVL